MFPAPPNVKGVQLGKYSFVSIFFHFLSQYCFLSQFWFLVVVNFRSLRTSNKNEIGWFRLGTVRPGGIYFGREGSNAFKYFTPRCRLLIVVTLIFYINLRYHIIDWLNDYLVLWISFYLFLLLQTGSNIKMSPLQPSAFSVQVVYANK